MTAQPQQSPQVLSALPPHLGALQILVNRCRTAEDKKRLIVTAGTCKAIGFDDGCLMVSANMLETA